MSNQIEVRSKLELSDDRVLVPVDRMIKLVTGIFSNVGYGDLKVSSED